jgi:purine-nucleoside/S-methyl-5'-thioadenosine phosphorylase / adenosine deaminase
MHRHSVNGLIYFTFESLQVTHAISSRHGGTSSAPFNTLNLSITVGDASSNVHSNIKRMHDAIALDQSCTVDASQAQADQIAIVDDRHRGTRIKHVDALLTKQPDLPLLLRFADCVPILLHDPAHRAIGVVHAGWRGTVSHVAAKSVQAMQQAFGTRTRDVIACIGPAIGPCCYKIRQDVISRVRMAFDNFDSILLQHNGSTYLDLWRANAIQLRGLGVGQIEIAEVCTADHVDDFYSWRAENKNTGRFGAIIALT